MSRILITGGLGFVGRNLERRLIKEGHEVYIFDFVRSKRERYFHGDIIDYHNISQAFKSVRPEVVFHLAAKISRKECEEAPYMSIETNVVGTLNVVDLCKEYSSRLIYSGSSEEYGDAFNEKNNYTVNEDTPIGIPTSYYAMTKRMSDEVIQYNATYNNLVATTVRFCMLYGAEDDCEYRSAVTRFIYAALRNDEIIAHKDTERSWCYINDAIDAMMLILNRKQEKNYELYNINNEEPVSAIDLAKIVRKLTKSKSKIKIMPVEPTIIPIKRMGFERMRSVFGWEPKILLKKGLKITIKDIINQNY